MTLVANEETAAPPRPLTTQSVPYRWLLKAGDRQMSSWMNGLRGDEAIVLPSHKATALRRMTQTFL